MELKVSSPQRKLKNSEIDRIEKDLQKIDRRLHQFDPVFTEVRINEADGPASSFQAILEVEYGRNHLVAKAESADYGQAIRAAREDILRQINDRSRGSHSQYAKGR